jgi:hypothetical protein
MNQMGHNLPIMTGVDQSGVAEKIERLVPGYMPMGNTGMGGMFTILKIREGLQSYDRDPGWYEHPAGTVAAPVGERQAPARVAPPPGEMTLDAVRPEGHGSSRHRLDAPPALSTRAAAYSNMSLYPDPGARKESASWIPSPVQVASGQGRPLRRGRRAPAPGPGDPGGAGAGHLRGRGQPQPAGDPVAPAGRSRRGGGLPGAGRGAPAAAGAGQQPPCLTAGEPRQPRHRSRRPGAGGELDAAGAGHSRAARSWKRRGCGLSAEPREHRHPTGRPRRRRRPAPARPGAARTAGAGSPRKAGNGPGPRRPPVNRFASRTPA